MNNENMNDQEINIAIAEAALPDTTCSRYVPSWMRDQTAPPPREVTYACGTEHRPGEFGMWWGPFPEEQHALEAAGKTLNDVIIRFNADWTDDVLWRWDGSGWVRKLEGVK